MPFLFDRLDEKLRNSRIEQLEKELEEARTAIKTLSLQNKSLRSQIDKGQHVGIMAWMEKYTKLEAEFLAYRQKCNLDGTAPKKPKKRKPKMRLIEQWSLQNNASGKDVFNP